MSNNKMMVDERQRDIGNFLVGRLLPFRKKRSVGPFVFIDHMGPETLGNGRYIDVDQHPHIGLSTLTYLLEGEIEHKDSTGARQHISAGDVGFMTAGRGVTHTERTPAGRRGTDAMKMHGYQVWVALPKEREETEPGFQFISSHDLPSWEQDGLTIKLVAGTAFGRTAPLHVFSPLFMVDVFASQSTSLDLVDHVQGEIAFVVASGAVTDGEDEVHAGQMLISKSTESCRIKLEPDTRLLIFGGEPFPEERFLLWNFSSSDKDRLQRAKSDWQNKRFPKITDDDTYIPFPA